MNKNIVTMSMIAFLAVSLVGLGFAGSHSFSEVKLSDAGNGSAEGLAKIKVSDDENLHNVDVKIKMKDLFPIEGYVFEGWFVDAETGYKLSLGGFTPKENGEARFTFSQKMVNFDLYDNLVITAEPINDLIPTPDTPVLVGNL